MEACLPVFIAVKDGADFSIEMELYEVLHLFNNLKQAPFISRKLTFPF